MSRHDISADSPAPHAGPICVARLRDGVVVLDIASNHYAGLYLPTSDPCADPRQDVVDALCAHGIGGAPGEGFSIHDGNRDRRHWQDCEPDPDARLRARDVLVFLSALLLASVRFHVRPFRTLVTRQQRDIVPVVGLAHHRAALARFERLSSWLPFRPLCLFRAHFLVHVLRCYGLSADWIFGVSLFPFHAHCWIAVGDHLLGDRAEKTEDYVPILSIINTRMLPA